MPTINQFTRASLFLLVLLVTSCSEAINDSSIDETERVDSMVVRNGIILDFANKDTLIVDLLVYPNTVDLISKMIDEHRLFLSKKDGTKETEPLAYKITDIERGTEGGGHFLYILQMRMSVMDIKIMYKSAIKIRTQ